MEYGKNWELCTKNILGRVVLFFAVFFLSVNAWSACSANPYAPYFSYASGECGNYDKVCDTQCPSSVEANGGVQSDFTGCIDLNSSLNDGNCPWPQVKVIGYRCQYQTLCRGCDADSVSCLTSGGSWLDDPSTECGKSCVNCDEQCQCEEEGGTWINGDCEFADSTACDSYKRECEGYGGKFTGSVVTSNISPTGCLSFCDMCTSKATELYRKTLAHQCCSKGQVPPADVTRCINQSNAPSPDMSFSNFECRGGFDCGCEQLSSENSSTYNQICNDDNWSSDSNNDNSSDSNNDDPSGGSSSSNDDSSNSSGPGDSSNSSGPGDDSSNSSGPGGSSNSSGPSGPGGDEGDGEPYDYRDSLHKIIDNTKNTKKAAEGILLCLLEPINCEAFDYPVFQFDTAFLKYLRPLMDSTIRIDSAQLKVLSKLDSNILKQLKTDSALLSNDTTTRRIILDGFGGLDSTFKADNDTTRKWLNRIADSIGVTSDSLAAHLDSILQHIPDSILDSIVKYQAYATDNFDSILYGSGKGFSLVDSLIDSAVKYFQISNHYDSVYRVMFEGFEDGLTDEFSDLPGRNASAIGSALGYGDTATSNLRGDLKGIKDAIEGLGDGLGGDIAGALDSAWGNGTAAEGSGFEDYAADSAGYIGVLGSYYSEGTTVDSAYLVGGDTCTSADCIVSNMNSNIDSMGQAFRASLDTQYQSLSDSSSVWFDSIKKNLMFVDFDSVLVGPLRQRIPNTNSCPENCFSFDVASGVIPGVNKITYPICKNFTIGGISTNGLLVVRLILRILTAMACIYIGLWFIAGKKG